MEDPIPYVNGIFKRAYSWVADAAAGLKMLPDRMDADANDIALGLSNALLRDGTGQPTADVSWAGKGITNLRAPANTGDALSLGTTPSSEVTRALGFGPVSGGPTVVNGGHAIAITYDGTGLTCSVDGNAAFGRVWTANTLTGAAINNILGYAPVSRDTGNAIGLAWSGGRIRFHVDNTDQGAAWTDTTLTAGQIGSILGYAPARPSGVMETSSGGASDISPNARQYVVGVSFVATASSFLGFGRTAFLNNSSGGAQDAYFNCDLIDVTAGSASVAAGVEIPVRVNYGGGWAQAFGTVACSGLTIGHTYQLRGYVYKTSTASVVATNSMELVGGFY